jgi:hypothetical protein
MRKNSGSTLHLFEFRKGKNLIQEFTMCITGMLKLIRNPADSAFPAPGRQLKPPIGLYFKT